MAREHATRVLVLLTERDRLPTLGFESEVEPADPAEQRKEPHSDAPFRWSSLSVPDTVYALPSTHTPGLIRDHTPSA